MFDIKTKKITKILQSTILSKLKILKKPLHCFLVINEIIIKICVYVDKVTVKPASQSMVLYRLKN